MLIQLTITVSKRLSSEDRQLSYVLAGTLLQAVRILRHTACHMCSMFIKIHLRKYWPASRSGSMGQSGKLNCRSNTAVWGEPGGGTTF